MLHGTFRIPSICRESCGDLFPRLVETVMQMHPTTFDDPVVDEILAHQVIPQDFFIKIA